MKGNIQKISNITYKPHTPLNNLECNQPLALIKPLVIKEDENNYLDANSLALIEQKRTQQMKEQQRSRISHFHETTKLNASKIWQQQTKKINESRKVKEEMIVKQSQLKQKYTIKSSTSRQIQQQPKKIRVQPTKVQWKKSKQINNSNSNAIYTQSLVIGQKKQQKSLSKSKSPLNRKQKSVERSQIAMPRYIEQQYSASESEADSQQQQSTLQQVLSRFSKLRTILKKAK